MRRLLAQLLHSNFRLIHVRPSSAKGVTIKNGVYTMLAVVTGLYIKLTFEDPLYFEIFPFVLDPFHELIITGITPHLGEERIMLTHPRIVYKTTIK
jgi:hypothetical protein